MDETELSQIYIPMGNLWIYSYLTNIIVPGIYYEVPLRDVGDANHGGVSS